MIISVTELRNYITTDLSDDVLAAKLAAIEMLIRRYTHNNFQNRAMRTNSIIEDGVILSPSSYFAVGDTVEITQSPVNNGLYVIAEGMTLDPDTTFDCESNLITKIVYPVDIQMGVVNMIQWDIDNRNKVGIQSETISRHSVTYFNMDGDNSLMGFPKSLLGFLEPYKKARF